MPMEQLPINNDGGQGYGFILYQTKLSQFPTEILIQKVLDRAQVMDIFSSFTLREMKLLILTDSVFVSDFYGCVWHAHCSRVFFKATVYL